MLINIFPGALATAASMFLEGNTLVPDLITLDFYLLDTTSVPWMFMFTASVIYFEVFRIASATGPTW